MSRKSWGKWNGKKNRGNLDQKWEKLEFTEEQEENKTKQKTTGEVEGEHFSEKNL